MKLPDYYRILEVPTTATVEEIKKAYRRLALANHPDRGGSHERMLAINEAFQVLADAAARSAYDQARCDETDTWALQKTQQDSARAKSTAGNYPKNYAEFEGWLEAMFRDWANARYGSEKWGWFQVPTVENSTSGAFLIFVGVIGGGILSWKLTSLFGLFSVVKGIPALMIFLLPIVGGAWVGQFLHACVKEGIVGNQPVGATNAAEQGSTAISNAGEQQLLVVCPRCEQKLRAGASRLDKQLRCPRCRTEFQAAAQSAGVTSVTPKQDGGSGFGFGVIGAVVGLVFFSRSCRTYTMPGLFTDGYVENKLGLALLGTAMVTAIAYSIGKSVK